MKRLGTFLLVCGMVLVTLMSGPAAAAKEVNGPPAQTPGGTYVVRPGDNLSSIAWRTYGNANSWVCIWYANSWLGNNPSYIQPGWVLTLPASGSCGPNVNPPPPPPNPRWHTVQRGQTLSGIACLYYYDCNYWRIVNANPRIWNPNYIEAGWVLYIP